MLDETEDAPRDKALFVRIREDSHEAMKALARKHSRSLSYLVQDLWDRYGDTQACDWDETGS